MLKKVFRFFFMTFYVLLYLIPKSQNSFNIICMLISKDMRMPSDKFLTNFVNSFIRFKVILLFMESKIHEYVYHDVTDFFSLTIYVTFYYSIKVFIAFIDKRLCCCLIGLNPVPRTAFRRAE